MALLTGERPEPEPEPEPGWPRLLWNGLLAWPADGLPDWWSKTLASSTVPAPAAAATAATAM